MAGFLTATWKGIYSPRAFSTWPTFFCTFPAIFSPMPSPSKSGSFVSSPTFSLIVPFTSWTLPEISFSVLGFILLFPQDTPCYEKRGRISVHIKTHLKIAWFSSGRTLLLTGTHCSTQELESEGDGLKLGSKASQNGGGDGGWRRAQARCPGLSIPRARSGQE